MEIDRSRAEIENPGAFVGRFAIRGQFQHVDFPKRQLRGGRCARPLGQRSRNQLVQVMSDEHGVALIFVQLPCTDRTMAARQAQYAAQTAILVMNGLGPTVLQSLLFKLIPETLRAVEQFFGPQNGYCRLKAMRHYWINASQLSFFVIGVPV